MNHLNFVLSDGSAQIPISLLIPNSLYKQRRGPALGDIIVMRVMQVNRVRVISQQRRLHLKHPVLAARLLVRVVNEKNIHAAQPEELVGLNDALS
jgi:hypothetical protein